MVSAYLVSHDLNFSNRPVRTRMPGGVAGAQPLMAAPYADAKACMFDTKGCNALRCAVSETSRHPVRWMLRY